MPMSTTFPKVWYCMRKTLGLVHIEDLQSANSESRVQDSVDTDSKIQSLRSAWCRLHKKNNAKNSRCGKEETLGPHAKQEAQFRRFHNMESGNRHLTDEVPSAKPIKIF